MNDSTLFGCISSPLAGVAIFEMNPPYGVPCGATLGGARHVGRHRNRDPCSTLRQTPDQVEHAHNGNDIGSNLVPCCPRSSKAPGYAMRTQTSDVKRGGSRMSSSTARQSLHPAE